MRDSPRGLRTLPVHVVALGWISVLIRSKRDESGTRVASVSLEPLHHQDSGAAHRRVMNPLSVRFMRRATDKRGSCETS